MKQSSRKFWLTFSFVLVAISAIFALKPAQKKEKPAQFVVDRLVNQLVCKTGNHRDSSSFRRGVLGSVSQKILSGKWDRTRDRDGDKYSFCLKDFRDDARGDRNRITTRQKNIQIAC